MHYDFRLKMDRVDTLTNPDFNIAEIDWLLNEAQLVFVKNRFGTNNTKHQGFEVTQKRIDDLSTLHVKFPEQTALTLTLDEGIYEATLSSLKYNMLFFLRANVDVILTGCTKKVPLKFVQSDDLSECLKDPFNASSLDYIVYNVGRSSTSTGTSIYLYPGGYTLGGFYPEYIKYPTRISYGGYTYIDGTLLTSANCELPEQTHSEIVDLAVLLAAVNVENPEYVSLKNLKIGIQE
jgi:hypothetical protein